MLRERVVEADGVRLFTVEAGPTDGPLVILLHGFPEGSTPGAVARENPAQARRSAYVALFQLPGLPERLLAAGDFALLRRALVRTSWPGTFPAEDLAVYREAWGAPGALTGMLNWYRALVRRPPKPVGPVRVPTRILWGRRDAALLPAFATASLALCGNGRILWYDDATHWVQHEEPRAVSRALVDFLSG